jgi:meiotically up-regulated gene 157 (Mug157) protein
MVILRRSMVWAVALIAPFVLQLQLAQAKVCPAGQLPIRSFIQTDEQACINPGDFIDTGKVSYAFDTEFELDEYGYFIRFLYNFHKTFPRFNVNQPMIVAAVSNILTVVETEQSHMSKSPYRRWELGNDGLGTPVLDEVGLVWTGARASDDKSEQHYNVPDNFFLAEGMFYLAQMFPANSSIRKRAQSIQSQILSGIATRAITKLDDGRLAFAYEVNGQLPNSTSYQAVFIDDANLPSLLSLPYISPDMLACPVNCQVNGTSFAQIYLNTRDYVLGKAMINGQTNPFFFTGSVASGIGSPHTPGSNIWPLGMITQGLTALDDTEAQGVLTSLMGVTCTLTNNSPVSSGYFHESFDSSDACTFTRAYFGWPNTLFTEFLDRFDWPGKPSYLANLTPPKPGKSRLSPAGSIPLPQGISQFLLSTFYTQDFSLSQAYTQNFDSSQPGASTTFCIRQFGGIQTPCKMTLMNTGDIIAMWTRDSAAQVNNYIGKGTDLSTMVEGVLFMQAFQIANTAYANAYSFTYGELYQCNKGSCMLFDATVPMQSPPGAPTTVPMGGIVQDTSLIQQ